MEGQSTTVPETEVSSSEGGGLKELEASKLHGIQKDVMKDGSILSRHFSGDHRYLTSFDSLFFIHD